jgi:NAD(P)-dependent dehydrogenase (short-subunit alcohol dehydrogenase family)
VTNADPRVVMITGCSSGIGRATAERFIREGWNVYPTARRVEAIADLAGTNVRPRALDLDDPLSVATCVARVLADAGRIDVLVNNAGFGQMGPLAELSTEKLRAQFETNVFGTMELTRKVLNTTGGMLEKKAGRIVMVGSVVGHVSTPFSGAYCGSKFALRGLSDALRMELRPFGIAVVQVEPGPIATSFADNAERKVAPVLGELGSAYEPFRPFIERRVRSSQEHSSPPSHVADVIFRAATRYGVTAQARLLKILRAVLPEVALDAILARRFGLR